MPARDLHHQVVVNALRKDGWKITDDPYVISYGERFLFVDVGATLSEDTEPGFIGAVREGDRIVVEIKQFQGRSAVADLEQAVGQYMVYQLLLNRVDPGREIYLAVSNLVFDEVFSEPIGELVIEDLPLQLLIVNVEEEGIDQWIPER